MEQHSKSIQGFTLLELMVAMTITVFISVGSYAMLQSVISVQKVSKEHSLELTQLQKAIWVITEDIEQMVPQSTQFTSDGNVVNFERCGWSNPLGLARSNLMHVAYEIDGKMLKRHYWSPEDNAATAQTQILLEDITDFKLQSFSPRALEVTFTTQLYGTIRRVIEMPES